MRKWRVTGTKHGKSYTVVIEAADHNAAVLKATKGRGLLRTILSKCATAIGNGASAAPDCSLEFLSGIPEEIALFSGKLREDAERYRWLRNDANTANNSAPMVATNPLDYEIQRLIHGDELDTAIDKARAEAGHG